MKQERFVAQNSRMQYLFMLLILITHIKINKHETMKYDFICLLAMQPTVVRAPLVNKNFVDTLASGGISELKAWFHEPQLQVEWSVTFLYSLVVERRC